MGSDVPLLGFFAVGDGLDDPLLPVISCLPHPLVGLPGFLCTLLVDVIGRVGSLAVALPPCGDPLVDGVGVMPTAALGQVRLLVEHVNSGVVSGVLLGGIVTDSLAVGRLVVESKFQGADH